MHNKHDEEDTYFILPIPSNIEADINSVIIFLFSIWSAIYIALDTTK